MLWRCSYTTSELQIPTLSFYRKHWKYKLPSITKTKGLESRFWLWNVKKNLSDSIKLMRYMFKLTTGSVGIAKEHHFYWHNKAAPALLLWQKKLIVQFVADMPQGHERLSLRVVTYEFKGLLALKESFTFRLFLQGKNGHSTHFYIKDRDLASRQQKASGCHLLNQVWSVFKRPQLSEKWGFSD